MQEICSGYALKMTCWSLMLSFDIPLSSIPFDGAFVDDSPLSWIARNSSKPGRRTEPESWVLHASPEWSRQNLETPGDVIERQLLTAFWSATAASRSNHGMGCVDPSTHAASSAK